MELAMKSMGVMGSMVPPSTELKGSVPGNRGIWVGILCELTEFALMFLAYAWFKYTHPEDFHRGPAMLYTACGVANTVTMLTSGSCGRASLTVRLRPSTFLPLRAAMAACAS